MNVEYEVQYLRDGTWWTEARGHSQERTEEKSRLNRHPGDDGLPRRTVKVTTTITTEIAREPTP